MGSFSKWVAEGMEKSGLSLRQVARESGLDPSFLSKVLAGKRTPPSDEKPLRRLAKVLGLDPVLLIVSTGLIPSELQETLENPELLKSLQGGKRMESRTASAGKPPRESRVPDRPKAQPPAAWPIRRPADLTEDLL
jgi:transcriptional regulator with XRE-family HTH domain